MDAARPLVVCLLPVRDGEQDLPGFLASAAGACDAVVALDDGSRDATPDLLEASPLVTTVLRNPRRPGYAGWDDLANRTRLLEAALALAPQWVLFLDADERLDAGDAAALRAFLATDAVPGCAFGLQHHRMWGPDASDPRFTWIYRVFAPRPGQRFPERRLHFDPVPTDIPRRAWMRTTIRVRHLGSMTEARRLAAVAKYRDADPRGELTRDFGGLLSGPPADLRRWRPRPAGLPVLLPAGAPAGRPAGAEGQGRERRTKLVCLLPARNCAADLPGHLRSVARFADAVVALDDGSTDETADVLRASPLVEVLLHNPRREGYAGWDEGVDRNRLLAAAADLEPDWILFLDADERLDEADGAALRAWIDGEARPGVAYGFEVLAMAGDEEHYDAGRRRTHGLVAYRLFAHEEGQELPATRLHAPPVPTSIPRSAWVPTTLRIQHLGGLTAARREARHAKYAEADPGRTYQEDYGHLLDDPVEIAPWAPRPPGQPVVEAQAAGTRALADELDLDAPVLSVVVISRDDEAVIARAVGAVVAQECPEPFEVIVVTSGTDATAAIVRERFPSVTLVELPRPALPGEARNAGLRLARGDWVTFPGSHVELPPGSLAARVRAHDGGYPLVTGSTLNGTRTPAGWASYYLDHTALLPGRPSGRLDGPPAHCSYLREALLAVGGFPEDLRAGEDTVVNMALHRRGLKAVRAQDVAIIHHSPCASASVLLAHHHGRGRGHGRILVDERGGPWPAAVLARHLARHVRGRLGRAWGNVRRWGTPRDRVRLAAVFPLVVAGALSAAVGAWREARRGGWGATPGRPGVSERPRSG